MSNKYELAPLANTAETGYLDEGNSRENMGGIDDGLTTNNEKPSTENDVPRVAPRPAEPPAAYPAFIPNPRGRRPLDVNLYATKKTVAQGMMDLALLTANANQLRYVLESGSIGPYYYFSVVLISMSIILQLLVGVALIVVGRYNMARNDHAEKADSLNNWVLLGVFLITLTIGIALIFLGRYNMTDIQHVDKAERLNNFVVLAVFLITAVNVLISAFGIEPIERMDPALIVDATLESLKQKTNASY